MLRARFLGRLDERRVRYLLTAFFVALAVPAALLIARAYDQLKWEAFRSNQVVAEDLAARIDGDLRAAVGAEEARSFGDYSFLVVEGDAAANFVQRSPLSAFPVVSALPGAIGYFQVDAVGALTTPLLPPGDVDAASFGIGADEQAARRALFTSLSEVLAENRLVPRSARADAALAAAESAVAQGKVVERSQRSASNESSPASPASAPSAQESLELAQTVPVAAREAEIARPSVAGASADARKESALPLSAAAPNAAADAAAPNALFQNAADSTASPSNAAAASAAPASATPPSATEVARTVNSADVASSARPSRAPAPSLSLARDSVGTLSELAKAEETQAAFDRLAPAQAAPELVAVDARERDTPPAVAAAAVGRDRDAGAARGETKAVAGEPAAQRRKRSEQSLVAEPQASSNNAAAAGAAAAKLEFRVRTFESELDPFEVGSLDTGHIVMFRNVWRGGQRYIQGVLIDRERFVAQAVEAAFRASSLAAMTDLAVSYRGEPLGTLRAAAGGEYSSTPAALAGSLLHRTRLSPPFGDLELAFSVNQLPRAPGGLLLLWISVILAVVLCGGFLLMYRFAVGQMRLARQQQDFVSAVSHELKTPLTSIRMYGEMLKAGWADDAKKQTYYDYIHSESERLSRLIENVLQLARLTRNTQHFDLKRATVAELMDMVRSKIATQIERAGFGLALRNDAPADAEVLVDADCFAQIFINLVDNALKFSASAERKQVEVASRRESDGTLLFTVRDFGPGIPKGQMKKIFDLFYRPENELTRETVGTGIGLALVRQLATAMGGRVDVRNCEPGAEFRVSFPPSA